MTAACAGPAPTSTRSSGTCADVPYPSGGNGWHSVPSVTTARTVGRVEEIWIYPVRSLAGWTVVAADVVPGGLAGDRDWTVVDEQDQVVRAKDVPALGRAIPTGDPDADAARLTELLDRPVRLVPTAPARGAAAPVHLVSRQAIDRAAGGDVPEGCSPDDPRANLLLSLGGDDERTWPGQLLRIGDAVLEVTRTPKHCLGVYADVRRSGVVRVGDAVLLDQLAASWGAGAGGDVPGPDGSAH